MLFHVGALTRLNELGYLPKIDRVSSVSGGSITAGVLGKQWRHLRFNGVGSAESFNELVTEPLRRIAGKTIDLPSILLGLLPLSPVGDRLAGAYGPHLFEKKTLQDCRIDPPPGIHQDTDRPLSDKEVADAREWASRTPIGWVELMPPGSDRRHDNVEVSQSV